MAYQPVEEESISEMLNLSDTIYGDIPPTSSNQKSRPSTPLSPILHRINDLFSTNNQTTTDSNNAPSTSTIDSSSNLLSFHQVVPVAAQPVLHPVGVVFNESGASLTLSKRSLTTAQKESQQRPNVKLRGDNPLLAKRTQRKGPTRDKVTFMVF